MDLETDKRQTPHSELAYSPRGETRKAGREEVELLLATHEPESPAARVEHWRRKALSVELSNAHFRSFGPPSLFGTG